MNKARLTLALAIVAILITVFAFGLDEYLTLEAFRRQQQELQTFVAANFTGSIAAYFVIYVFVTAFSIPGAAVMTLVGGALFGLVAGTVVVSFASTLGATLAFLFARFLFRDAVERRFEGLTERLAAGIDKGRAVLPVHVTPRADLPVFSRSTWRWR